MEEGQDVNLVLSWEFSAHQNRAFIRQCLSKLMQFKCWVGRSELGLSGVGGGGFIFKLEKGLSYNSIQLNAYHIIQTTDRM